MFESRQPQAARANQKREKKYEIAEEHNLNTEIIRIVKVFHRRPRLFYELEYLNGTLIDGQFNKEKLTLLLITSRTTYKLHKIRTRESAVAFGNISSAGKVIVRHLARGSLQ